MVNYHLGCFYVHGILKQPLGEISVRAAADFEEQILDIVQLLVVAGLVVGVVA